MSEDGHGVVHGWFDPPLGEVLVRHVATFRFASGSDEVIAYTDELDAGGEHVVHSFYSTVLPLIAWACDGVEAVHASAVRSSRGVVTLSGPSESGKTTLAYGLASRGHERFAEDAVAFRAAPSLSAIPLPFTTNLRPPSIDHFADSGWAVPLVREVHGADGVAEAPIEALFLLAPEAAAEPVVVPLTASEALLELLPNAHRFRGQPAERERRMLEAYLALVSEVPAYRLVYEQDFGRFDEVLDAVEAALERSTR